MKGIELNRATFRRLVQLYIVTLLLSSVPAIWQLFDPFWKSFDERFEQLVLSQFGQQAHPDWLMWTAGISFVLVGTWSVASMVGLLWFKRWARLGFWASAIPLLALASVTLGFRPYFATMLDDIFGIVGEALFGAIVLLSYAEGLGAEWFAPPENNHLG